MNQMDLADYCSGFTDGGCDGEGEPTRRATKWKRYPVCRYCGKTCLVWVKKEGKWRLADFTTSELHVCNPAILAERKLV